MAKKHNRLSWWYFLAKYVMLFFFKILHPYRILGRENMPKTGKVLVCSNHVTLGDPIYLGCAIPGRQLHYMAKAELFKNKLIGGFLKSLGAFPIARGTGGAQGIQTAIRLLEDEEVVCMFPEGTRSKTGEPLNPKTGLAMLAYKTKCTIVPVAIIGESGKPPKVFKKMVINIGKPIPFETLGLTEESNMLYRRVSREVFDHVKALREESLDIIENRWKTV